MDESIAKLQDHINKLRIAGGASTTQPIDIIQKLINGAVGVNCTKNKLTRIAIMSEKIELHVKTSERCVIHNGKTVCCWREGIDRTENKPLAIFDFNYDWMESVDWDEISKENLMILRDSFDAIIKDAEEHGL